MGSNFEHAILPANIGYEKGKEDSRTRVLKWERIRVYFKNPKKNWVFTPKKQKH